MIHCDCCIHIVFATVPIVLALLDNLAKSATPGIVQGQPGPAKVNTDTEINSNDDGHPDEAIAVDSIVPEESSPGWEAVASDETQTTETEIEAPNIVQRDGDESLNNGEDSRSSIAVPIVEVETAPSRAELELDNGEGGDEPNTLPSAVDEALTGPGPDMETFQSVRRLVCEAIARCRHDFAVCDIDLCGKEICNIPNVHYVVQPRLLLRFVHLLEQERGHLSYPAIMPVLRAAVAYTTHPVVRGLDAKRPARIEYVEHTCTNVLAVRVLLICRQNQQLLGEPQALPDTPLSDKLGVHV